MKIRFKLVTKTRYELKSPLATIFAPKNQIFAPFGSLFGTKFASKISKKPPCRADSTILGPKLAPRASKNRDANHTRAQDSARACQVRAKTAPRPRKVTFTARPPPKWKSLRCGRRPLWPTRISDKTSKNQGFAWE